MSSEPIWLIGMMGVGKSTVAPLVAEALNRDWIDSDDEIEQATGRTIEELFAESEEAFRAAERDAIASLASCEAVVAAGGGAPVGGAGETMRASGFVVWLQADVATLTERVGDGVGRPLLGGDVHERLMTLAAQRADRYRTVAHVAIDTADRSPGEVAHEVVEAWQNR